MSNALTTGFSLLLMILAFTPSPGRAEVIETKSVATSGEVVQTEQESAPGIAVDSMLYRSIKYVGKYHLLAIHFPIALLLMATAVQWHSVATGRGGSLVPPLLWFGTVGAVAAAALGWMYAYDSVYFGDDERLLFLHRWLGTSTAVFAVLVLLLKKRLGPKSFSLALTLSGALVAIAAHFGASLVNGADFLKKF